eukprot:11065818-Alexandrium_andersonii.AAC.1
MSVPPGWRGSVDSAGVASRGGGVLRGAPFALTCPAGCGNVITLPSRPCKETGGMWPRVKCDSCRAVKRCGSSRC